MVGGGRGCDGDVGTILSAETWHCRSVLSAEEDEELISWHMLACGCARPSL